MKKIIYTLVGICLLVAILLDHSARAQVVTEQCSIQSLHQPINVAIRNFTLHTSHNVAGDFIPLPQTISIDPDGFILQNGLRFIITDIVVEYVCNPGSQIDLFEQSQNLFVNNLKLINPNTWHSNTGLLFTGNTDNAVGIVLRKLNGEDPDPIVNVSLTGYIN